MFQIVRIFIIRRMPIPPRPETEPLRLLSALRPDLERLLRSRGVAPATAIDLLTAAAVAVESRLGALPGARARMVQGLDALCRQAGAGAGSVGSPRGVAPVPAAGERAFAAAFAAARARLQRRRRRIERERAAAPALAAELLALPAEARAAALAARRFRSRTLAEHLLEASRWTWTEEPARGEPLAALALDVLAALAGKARSIPAHARLADLHAVAWIYIGNARRILFDLRGAESALSRAEDFLVAGSGDPRERALLLAIRASLRRAQRRFLEAQALLEQAAAIYRWAGDRHEEGQVLLSLANVRDYAGDPDGAVPLVHRALELVDPERDPRLPVTALHNLASYLITAGRLREAAVLLPEVRRRTAAVSGRLELLLVRWLEGQLSIKQGDRRRGEEILTALRDDYLSEGLVYNTALVSLELVALYLDQGRADDARRLAAEMIPVFHSREIHREALAAWIALGRATEMETASAGLVREVAELLQRMRASGPPQPERPS